MTYTRATIQAIATFTVMVAIFFTPFAVIDLVGSMTHPVLAVVLSLVVTAVELSLVYSRHLTEYTFFRWYQEFIHTNRYLAPAFTYLFDEERPAF